MNVKMKTMKKTAMVIPAAMPELTELADSVSSEKKTLLQKLNNIKIPLRQELFHWLSSNPATDVKYHPSYREQASYYRLFSITWFSSFKTLLSVWKVNHTLLNQALLPLNCVTAPFEEFKGKEALKRKEKFQRFIFKKTKRYMMKLEYFSITFEFPCLQSKSLKSEFVRIN